MVYNNVTKWSILLHNRVSIDAVAIYLQVTKFTKDPETDIMN